MKGPGACGEVEGNVDWDHQAEAIDTTTLSYKIIF